MPRDFVYRFAREPAAARVAEFVQLAKDVAAEAWVDAQRRAGRPVAPVPADCLDEQMKEFLVVPGAGVPMPAAAPPPVLEPLGLNEVWVSMETVTGIVARGETVVISAESLHSGERAIVIHPGVGRGIAAARMKATEVMSFQGSEAVGDARIMDITYDQRGLRVRRQWRETPLVPSARWTSRTLRSQGRGHCAGARTS